MVSGGKVVGEQVVLRSEKANVVVRGVVVGKVFERTSSYVGTKNDRSIIDTSTFSQAFTTKTHVGVPCRTICTEDAVHSLACSTESSILSQGNSERCGVSFHCRLEQVFRRHCHWLSCAM